MPSVTFPVSLESGCISGLLAEAVVSESQLPGLHHCPGSGSAIARLPYLHWIASGKADFVMGGFGSNGFGEHSLGRYSMQSALICEVVMTAMFLFVILGATDKRAPAGLRQLPSASASR